jgi:hypothetical protein
MSSRHHFTSVNAQFFVCAGIVLWSVNINGIVRFEAFTAVTMKNVVFWDVAALCRTWVDRRFGGTYRLHLQGGMIRER